MANPGVPEIFSTASERIWRQIAGQFREACILRREGRHAAAAAILEQELPPVIKDWYASSGLAAADAKERLGRLFNEEQARVESHWIMARFGTAAAPGPARASHPYAGMQLAPIGPRRIPVDAVTDMIDTARESGRTVLTA